MSIQAVEPAAALSWRNAATRAFTRELAEETPVAFTFQGSTYAVLMASPADLEDFALGFCLTEGIVAAPDEIERIEIIELAEGIELRIGLGSDRQARLTARRRTMAGPTGCGLCGVESLEEALRPAPAVVWNGRPLPAPRLLSAMAELERAQPLNARTRALHAAAFWSPGRGLELVREDVGRHNALDKLCGALARGRHDAGCGALIMTSRISVELVQKAAQAGLGLIVAVSAPTALAVRTARQAGIALAAVARADGFELFTHPERVEF